MSDKKYHVASLIPHEQLVLKLLLRNMLKYKTKEIMNKLAGEIDPIKAELKFKDFSFKEKSEHSSLFLFIRIIIIRIIIIRINKFIIIICIYKYFLYFLIIIIYIIYKIFLI